MQYQLEQYQNFTKCQCLCGFNFGFWKALIVQGMKNFKKIHYIHCSEFS